jgi:hypothetical protein
MSTPTITDPAQLEAAYQRTEQLLQEAAEAEHAAFVQWQEAYGAYESPAMTQPLPDRTGRKRSPRDCGARSVGPGNQYRPGAPLHPSD